MAGFLRALGGVALATVLGSAALAAHVGGGGGGVGHGFGGGGMHGGGGVRGGMPPHGFRSAPPGFHGSLPHGSFAGGRVGHISPSSGPQHGLGLFHGHHNYAHLTGSDRDLWQHGNWRHTSHHGHYGWWWYADDSWFYYPEPIYPYPDYIGADDYYDYYDQYGTPQYYWYHCDDPQGYYPYVQYCNGPWQPVPPTPGAQ